MDFDDVELFQQRSNGYLVHPRVPLVSPLYRSINGQQEISIRDQPLTNAEHLRNLKNFCWNRETKRFCRRDGLDWAKLGCYYSVFLFVLGLLFSTLVIVYMLLIDKKTPRRYGNDSALALDGGINPGDYFANPFSS